ncbi:MAG: nicotinate phosphoribosyltransferase [Chlamydiae bacterium]|nr:nicotinate phosphoribosyltransferase [Chlamydiota bacterium]
MKQAPFSKSIYSASMTLLTDLYELTMAYGYWKKGMADRKASFYLSFRRKPFHGEYAIAAGLQTFIEYLENFQFDESDIAYLRTLKDPLGSPLFEEAFLVYLKDFSFSCDIDAMPEGTICFPYEPLIRVTGPILQAQIIESVLLNIINFQTLIATKASRVCWAARKDPVAEFGLRRAQGMDGAISASRAAYIGGCHSTSNTLAGKLYGIPVAGTHAHSWIMAFDDELTSFYAFSEALPNSCIFLIDTYNTISGVKNAIKVAKDLRAQGKEMIGVRLDSGDLSRLSIEVRTILDEAGFPEAKIMASNELDEFVIRDLKAQGAKVNIWGVGTNLVTGKEQPALDGVYKLSSLQDDEGNWQDKIKISEQWAKVTNPGLLQVRRFTSEQGYLCDAVYDIQKSTEVKSFLDPFDPSNEKEVQSKWSYKDLLVPVVRGGKVVYQFPPLDEIRDLALAELDQVPHGTRRFLNPQPYFVGLERTVFTRKLDLIKEIKNKVSP